MHDRTRLTDDLGAMYSIPRDPVGDLGSASTSSSLEVAVVGVSSFLGDLRMRERRRLSDLKIDFDLGAGVSWPADLLARGRDPKA